MDMLDVSNFNDFVMLTGKDIVTDSRRVAKAFGKRHDNVLHAIKTRCIECGERFANLNFKVCYENNELQNGKPLKFYRMTKDGFMSLVMKFTGKRAARMQVAFIDAFNAMADYIRQQMSSTKDVLYRIDVEYEAGKMLASANGRALRKWRTDKTNLSQNRERLCRTEQLSLFLNAPHCNTAVEV